MRNLICISCGKHFTLTDKEIAFFKSRNLSLPKRCETCRAKRNEIEKRSKKNFVIKMFERALSGENNLTKIQNSYKFAFKDNEELKEHFIKHGRECNCKTPKKYLKTANKIIKSKKSLKKSEKEDGDLVFYNHKTGGIVFLSAKGYIRSFYIADIDYFKRQ